MRPLILLILSSLMLAACSSNTSSTAKVLRLNGHTMGTMWSVKLVLEDATAANFYWEAIQDELDNINSKMSTYQADSEVSRLNSLDKAGCVDASKETLAVVGAALALSEQSSGAFDITVGPLVNAWGFGPDYTDEAVPDADRLLTLAKSTGYQHIRIQDKKVCKDQGATQIDLSAIAKGYAVDQVARYLDRIEMQHYLVEVGGELFARGNKPDGSAWRIGIETPSANKREVFENTIVPLVDIAIASSGDYRNYFEKNGLRYSHTIDPRTAKPIAHTLASVTVVAENSMLADAWATALMVLGPQDGLKLANTLQLPVLMLVRVDDGFLSQPSDAFTAYMAKQL